MTKKIVAIGGGENGRYLGNGKYREYETEPMDKEIIRLTGKENPNYLFMVHAQPFNNTIEEGYFETMKKILRGMAKGAVNQANINAQELQSIKVYIPDMELQRQYVEFKEEIDKSRSRIQKSLEASQELFDSLMQDYFG